MKLADEYSNQNSWRNWETYIERLPIDKQDTILDFGCSLGFVSKLLAKKAHRVVGVDNNPELLKEAKQRNSGENISYFNMDLGALNFRNLPLADGIWTSFVVAYFPDIEPILYNWIKVLKPNGWIAIVEMSDLFAHQPLGQSTTKIFKEYYLQQRKKNRYDFEMGRSIKGVLTKCGFLIIHEENKIDRELSFNGPAEPQILESWACRFDRMLVFKEYVGEKKFLKIKNEFLDCLTDKEHKSETLVKFIIASK